MTLVEALAQAPAEKLAAAPKIPVETDAAVRLVAEVQKLESAQVVADVFQ